MSFHIEEVQEADLPKMLENSHAAFINDSNTLFKMHEEGTTDFASQMPMAMFGGIFPPKDPPKALAYKAIDDESGEIVGHILWGLWNLQGQNPEVYRDTSRSADKKGSEPAPPDLNAPIEYPDVSDKSPLDQLKNRCTTHIMAMMDRLCPAGKPVVYCRGITVHPKAQSRGIGSAMVKKSCEYADKYHASMWNHLSDNPAVLKAFEKSGFHEVHSLEEDLDSYRTKELPEGREKWGKYKFRVLFRDAH